MNRAFTQLFYINLSLSGILFVTFVTSPGLSAKRPSRKVTHRKVAQAKSTTPPAVPFQPIDALKDPKNRIAHEFAVPQKMEERTAFWFDVYTRYSKEEHILHHVLYPWIIFKVVDTRPIEDSNAHRWVKYHKARRLVQYEKHRVRRILRHLAKRKSYINLKPEEQELFDRVASIPGPRRKIFREAAANLRDQLGQKDYFLSGLESSAKYLPLMEKAFIDRGLPAELTRLPFVESSFNVTAESKVGASGIWQIMPTTGKSYLLVNQHIDERNSPLKASLAAVQIFNTNFRSLKSWPLAVTAYNHGAAGVRRALRIARTDNLPDLIDRYHGGSFKFASANFYSCFLAALHAEKYHAEIFNRREPIEKIPLDHQIVSLQKSIRVRQLLKNTGMSLNQLLEYNLDLRNAAKVNARLPRGYRLILPPAASENLEKTGSKASRMFKEAALILTTSTSG